MQFIIMEKHSNQITHHDETKKRAHDSQSELKKTSSWATVGPATDKHQALKLDIILCTFIEMGMELFVKKSTFSNERT